jgi:hypothetical protein
VRRAVAGYHGAAAAMRADPAGSLALVECFPRITPADLAAGLAREQPIWVADPRLDADLLARVEAELKTQRFVPADFVLEQHLQDLLSAAPTIGFP